jgi:hypothetical protein
VEGHPPVGAISRSCPVETLRQYNLTQSRKGAKKVLAGAVIVKIYFGDDAPVTGIRVKQAKSDSFRLFWRMSKKAKISPA